MEHRVIYFNWCDLHIEDYYWQHICYHLLTHRPVWEPNEHRMSFLNQTCLRIHLTNCLCGVGILCLRDIKIVIHHPLSKWDDLLLIFAIEFIIDLSTILFLDNGLVLLLSKREMIDLVREIYLVCFSHQGDDYIWNIVRRYMEISRYFMKKHLTFHLASFLILKRLFS